LEQNFGPEIEAILAETGRNREEYMLPWEGAPCKGGGKTLFKVGVNFDSEKRNIGEWKYTSQLPG